MKEFRRSSVNLKDITPITKTEKEKVVYQKAMMQFEKEMKAVRADAIYKAAQSHLSASKTILNS